MTAFAQTVTGPRPAAELGLTLMHEHILCDLRRPEDRGPADRHPAITCENRFETDYFQNRNPLNMFLDEDDAAARATIRAYQKLISGAESPDGILRRVSAQEKLGVTEGTLV